MDSSIEDGLMRNTNTLAECKKSKIIESSFFDSTRTDLQVKDYLTRVLEGITFLTKLIMCQEVSTLVLSLILILGG